MPVILMELMEVQMRISNFHKEQPPKLDSKERTKTEDHNGEVEYDVLYVET